MPWPESPQLTGASYSIHTVGPGIPEGLSGAWFEIDIVSTKNLGTYTIHTVEAIRPDLALSGGWFELDVVPEWNLGSYTIHTVSKAPPHGLSGGWFELDILPQYNLGSYTIYTSSVPTPQGLSGGWITIEAQEYVVEEKNLGSYTIYTAEAAVPGVVLASYTIFTSHLDVVTPVTIESPDMKCYYITKSRGGVEQIGFQPVPLKTWNFIVKAATIPPKITKMSDTIPVEDHYTECLRSLVEHYIYLHLYKMASRSASQADRARARAYETLAGLALRNYNEQKMEVIRDVRRNLTPHRRRRNEWIPR